MCSRHRSPNWKPPALGGLGAIPGNRPVCGFSPGRTGAPYQPEFQWSASMIPIYPADLKQIYDPPLVLYVRGNVEAIAQPGVAVADFVIPPLRPGNGGAFVV